MPFGVSWGRGQEGGVLLEAPETQIQYKGSQPTQTSGIQCKACLCCPHLCQALGSQVGKPGLRLVVAVRQARAGLLCCCLGLDTHSQPTALLIPAANNGSAMVRVISVSTSERTLLKGFMGSVADLAFAHVNSPQLACLDEAGNLFVWHLALVNGKIQYPFPGMGWGTEERWAELIIHLVSP